MAAGDGPASPEGDPAALRGLPSYVWRYGQDRRLALIDRYAPLAGRRILDVGCGIGTYVEKLRQFSDQVYGIDIEVERVLEGGQRLPNLLVAAAESPPFTPGSFDVILLHEVLEHVQDDRQVVHEAHRLLAPGGRMVIFVPNRLYPFETHGVYWRGSYRFGNFPLVNYLPHVLRQRLCPHVRAYTGADLRRLLSSLDHHIVVHTQIYPGYDNIVARHHRLGSLLRRVTYSLEKTPLRLFGLSHLLVVEKPTALAASTSVR
jgi:SAM-dependent methyltransferase